MNPQLNLNLCVIGWANTLKYGKYTFSELFFIKKTIVIFVINESQGKMLGDNNFSGVEKLSNSTALYFIF